MSDQYSTIKEETSVEIKIERSEFIGYVKEVSTEEEAKAFISYISNEHKQATHNCPAYRIGWDKSEITYSSDDGEPSGTAGKPILGAILKNNLTNLVIVVTRYFGGKKLGVRGLIDAYGTCAQEVIAKAGIQEKTLQDKLRITADYPKINSILYWLDKYQAEITARDYGEHVVLEFLIRQKDRDALAQVLQEYGAISDNLKTSRP